ncbi:disease resistance protein RPM1 [Vigna unguiculata]|uniref:Disease resistance protein RPM1 n=1 Tax=Vigna unguiculata TaxID=3917 RepID=A0A4D6MZG0_VIGUN|nr:disease resistance protein RPM1 [Vigna unguiculata]
MAESLLFSFAESLIGKLASGAVHEASLALGVHADLQQMEESMSLIRAFLLDAEQKKPLNNSLSEWLRQIKQVFSDAEDIVDDFECEALRKHVVNTHGGLTGKVRRFFSTSNPLIYRIRMAHEIKDIKQRLQKVAADGNTFGLQIIDQDTRVVHVTDTTHSHVNPSNVVGRQHEKQEILNLLLQHEGKEERYPQLLEIGKEIVNKCGGIPLAVKTLASSLFSVVDKTKWEAMRDDKIWNLPQKEKDILPALEISYNQLPSHLKPCFVCFSLFGEGSEFVSFYVAKLWEALGFLPPPKENETMHDVAIQFLRELWSRSFLTDFIELSHCYIFKLHDLVHDLAMYAAKGEFQTIYPRSSKISPNARHLAFSDNNLLDQAVLPTGLRTIIFPDEATNEAFLNTLVSRCKYLRFLELSNSKYETLPRSVGKLKHLRYLCLFGNKNLKGLPCSVCNLQNLENLNLNECTELQELPKGISKLISLRQLHITTKQLHFPDQEISTLTSLETLTFNSCDNLESLLKGIQLSSLTNLSLHDCGKLKTLSFHVIANLEHLLIDNCCELELSMGFGNGNQIPDLRLKSLAFKSLQQLVTLPQWLQGSVNTLHSLVIADCNNLKELPEWLSSAVFLKLLVIEYCSSLQSLPDNLINLENLLINSCPELCKRYQPGVGQDYHKISHIKKVFVGELEE